MKLVEDPTLAITGYFSAAVYCLNEHAQELRETGEGLLEVTKWDPYKNLSPSISEFLLNYASTFSGSLMQNFLFLTMTGAAFKAQKESTKLIATFASVSTVGALNILYEVDSIPRNLTQALDTKDLMAVGIALTCFTGLMLNHIRKNRKKQTNIP